MSNRIPRSLCLALVICSPGCFFKSPLDADARTPIDAAVLGTWRCLGFDEGPAAKPANFVVSRADDRRYSIVLEQEDEEPDNFEAYASVVKGQTLLNVRIPKPKFPLEPWAVARYSFLRPNVVHVQIADESKLKGADESPASFRRAFEKAQDEPGLFGDYCICVRVKD